MFQKESKRIYRQIFISLLVFSGIFFAWHSVLASDTNVDYGDKVIVDSDLDGLTDEGERQLYGTDAKLPDTDGDGIYDGVEVLQGMNPLSPAIASDVIADLNREIPWAWYVSRSSGFVGYAFLWSAIFLGLAIRNNLLKKIVEPIYSFPFHCFLAVSAVFWGLFHGLSLMFHGQFALSLGEVFIPLYLQSEFISSGYMAWGIIAFYMMVVMTVTSYLRNKISHTLWRWTHFMHPLAFIFVVVHGILLGTDIKIPQVKFAFLFLAFLLVLIYVSSLIFLVLNRFKSKTITENHGN